MNFSEKMRLIIIIKVTKNQALSLFLENIFSENPEGAIKFAINCFYYYWLYL